MTVVSFVNQKGGVGKTTLAIHLAMALTNSGRVLLVDADPQGSALDWQARRETATEFPVVGLARPVLHREVAGLGKSYDWVVIDSPPRTNTLVRSAIAASDLALIPVQPSPLDIWAAQDILDILDEVAVLRPRLQARFVVNRLFVGTRLGAEVGNALADFRTPALRTAIRNRTEYAKAAREGRTAIETAPGSAAANDFRTLANEIQTVVEEVGHAIS